MTLQIAPAGRRESWYWTVRHAQGILRRPREVRALWRTVSERRSLARRGFSTRPRPRVLAYHSVDQPEMFVNNISTRRLRGQLQHALERGYRFGTLDEILAARPDEPMLAVSFDDGFRSVLRAAPILDELGVPWTMFVTTSWASGHHHRPDIFLTWGELAELVKRGVQLGCHSATHPDFGSLDAEAAAADLRASRDAFEEHLGFVPRDLAIPFGNASNWTSQAQEAAQELGFERVWAQCESLRPSGTLGRSFVCGFDRLQEFDAMLGGAFDEWEEPAPV
jgi:peptidoglycan/xylan/chitin deacetylase (PgdA/CDA1 family)